MRLAALIVLVLAGLWGVWALSGIGFNIHKSEPQPGGEVGIYFTCTYLGARRSFQVNYSDASTDSRFWEPRHDCPATLRDDPSRPGWVY